MASRITYIATLVLTLTFFASCEKENTAIILELDDQIKGVTINEFVAKGSDFQNTLGVASDWFELYNDNSTDLTLEANRWHCTDNFERLTKFTITEDIVIPGNGHLIIWADGLNRVDLNGVHTNFRLNNEGEQIILSYTDDAGKIRIIDFRGYERIIGNNKSFGRLPDGSSNWTELDTPSPNGFN